MYSGDMMRHAFGSFDHNSWSAQGAVRSAAHRFVHTFLRKLLVCPQIRPLFYPQTAGGSTDSSTNCHFCPQAAFLTANHDVCRHTRPQMSADVRSVVHKEPLLSAVLSANCFLQAARSKADLSAHGPLCPQICSPKHPRQHPQICLQSIPRASARRSAEPF